MKTIRPVPHRFGTPLVLAGLILLTPRPRAPAADSRVAAIAPVDLRCESAVDPLGVDVTQPRLSWTLESPRRGERQLARQLLVASSPERLARDEGDLWDSGKVESEESLHVSYAGKPLSASAQVWWKVRAWNQAGEISRWSKPATWTMGVLETNDWKAAWICAPGATETLLLRKEFAVRPGLVRALLHVCGLGQYELTLNGTKAGEDMLSPGWTDYNKTVLYETKNVTGLLREGTNAIGLVLGNGMYNVVRRNRFVKFTGSFGALRAIVQLRLDYADGSTQFVGTDETWWTHAGPVVFSNIYGGEDRDARLEPAGWDKVRFEDSGWPGAVEIVRPQGRLRGQPFSADPLRVIEVHKAVAMPPLTDGETVYDLGQNTAHIPRLRVSGPAGSTVRLTPGEILGPGGQIDRSTMGGTSRGSAWWQYTKATDHEESWTPQFCYIGCRYLQAQLTPARPTDSLPRIESLEGLVVHSSAAPAGEFACSNELLNRIRNLVRWAQRANMVSVFTDCPHREKLGWLEQYHLNGPSLRYEFAVSRIFNKGMNDMAEAQLDNGLVPNIAPEYTQFKGTFRAAAEWGSAFIIVPWQHYQFTADLEPLRRHYGALKRYFAYLESKAENDIVSEGLGDWYDLGPKKPGAAQLTPPPVTASAFYYYDASLLSQSAALLGRTNDAQHFSEVADRLRASFNRHFFHPDTDSYASGSQCANALPLVFGIVPPEHRAAVVSSLVRDVESRAYAMTAGDVGFRFLLQALAQNGHSDAIYKMINQDDKPGYGFQLKMGATSLTESWDANHSSSHDHFMLGQIIEWFYKDLAGIDCDPAGPGFKKILIKPSPVGDLKWVEATYHSVRGPISVRWERSDGRFHLDVAIPANTTATIWLPASSVDTVTENGVAADRSAEVRFLRQEQGRIRYEIGSGRFTFESNY